MTKFFKNLGIWLGWFYYKKEILYLVATFLLAVIPFIVCSRILVHKLFLQKIDSGRFDTYVLIMQVSSLVIYGALLGIAAYFKNPSKNWQIAIAEAQKLIADAKYKIEIPLLQKLITRAQKTNSGKEIARVIDLIRIRDGKLAQKDKFTSQLMTIPEIEKEISKINKQIHFEELPPI